MDDDDRAAYDARFTAMQDQIDELTRTVTILLEAVEALRADRDATRPPEAGPGGPG